MTCRASTPGRSCPGFRMPLGSNACLTRFMRAIIVGVTVRAPRYGALVKPMPCSPLIDPSSATTPRTGARSASCARRDPSGSSGVDHDVDVDVAVPHVTEATGSAARTAASGARRARRAAGLRPCGTTTSWLILSGAIIFSDGESSRRTRHSSCALALVVARAAPRSRRPRGTPLDARGLLATSSAQAIHFDQQHRSGARRARATGAEMRATAVETVAVDQFQRRRHDARPNQRVTASTAACTSGSRAQRGLGRRLGDEAQVILRDNRQRAFGPDQQLRQVVADDVLHRPCRRCG